MAMEERTQDEPVEKGELLVSVPMVNLRVAREGDYESIVSLGATVAEGMRFFVAESNGKIVACLGEKDGNTGQRWLMDWHGDGSKIGSLGLLRLERDFEQRAIQDPEIRMVVGISEPQPNPNLQAAVDKGWAVLGVLLGKAV